jgi:ribosomal protein S18 acetylase RimI-like enzyme
MPEFQINVEPAPGDVRSLEDRLYEYNVEQTGTDDGKWLSIFVRDDTGGIVAGLHGWTWCGSCRIQTVWVHKDLRRQNYGTRLLLAAEQEARARGCEQILLDTFSFQAPLFYQKLGYEVINVVERYPRSPHSSYCLRKTLR